VRVAQGSGRGLSGQPVHRQQAGVALAQGGQPAVVPGVSRTAQQQVEAFRRQGFAQPAVLPVAGDAGVLVISIGAPFLLGGACR